MVSSMFAMAVSVVSCGSTGSSSKSNEQEQRSYTIKTEIPVRPAGQKNVLGLTNAPIETLRVAVIGLGMRGPGAVAALTNIPGVEIVALCDVLEKNTKKANTILEKAGMPKAKEFFGDTSIWRQVTALPNVDLIYCATDWKSHATIGVQAMKDGKHVAIEVPSAMTLDDIWALINTSEQTRKHCMQLENCVYDTFEITTLNMAQQGLFGEVIHGEGAYIHELSGFWKSYWEDWRLDFNRKNRGDVYATHGMGPICQVMNIHRGDKINVLVAMDSKPHRGPQIASELYGEEVTDYKAGDHTTTMLKTELGKTIQIQHDVVSPRPYSRMYQVSGDKGFANKYPVTGFALDATDLKNLDTENPDIENLNAHGFVPKDVKEALLEKYKPRILVEIGEEAKKVGGHGGMDFVMIYRLAYCLKNGLPLDMDVYDLAEWCAVTPLSAISLENGYAPVEFPDFTRGHWNDVKGYKQVFVD